MWFLQQPSEDRQKISISQPSLASSKETIESNPSQQNLNNRRPLKWTSIAKPFVRCVKPNWRKNDYKLGVPDSDAPDFGNCSLPAQTDDSHDNDEHLDFTERDSAYSSGRSRSPYRPSSSASVSKPGTQSN